MFGLSSLRCVQGCRWLRAFNLVRGNRNKSCHMNILQHLWPGGNHGCTLIKVRSSSSFSNESDLQTVDKPGQKTSKTTQRSGKTMLDALDDHPSEDSNFLADLVLQSDVDLPSKTEIRSSEWFLDHWYHNLRKIRKSRHVALWDVVTNRFQSIVVRSMMQGTPAVIREKSLRLLLTEDDDCKLTEKLLTQTLESSSHLPMKTIANIVQMLSEAKQTELRTMVRKGLVTQAVNKRWYEINQKYIVSFMYQLDELFDMKTVHGEIRNICKSNDTTDGINTSRVITDSDIHSETGRTSKIVPVLSTNVDRCILDVVDELKPKDLARILTLMGKWRNRNETLFAALIHRLNLADLSDFTFVQLANLLFATSTLAIHNEALLDKIVVLLHSLDPVSPTMIISVLASLSHIRWYNPDFIVKILNYIEDHVHGLTGKEAGNILMSLANLYVLPVQEKHKELITALGNQALSDGPSRVDTVNVFWSLAILHSLDKDQVGFVLEPSFVQQFQDTNGFQNIRCLRKLQQINTAAKLEINSYDGACIPENILESLSIEETVKTESKLQSTLSHALSKFVNITSYVKLGARLPGGYKADALMCADADGNLKPLTHYENENSRKKSYLLALKVIPFSGVIIPQKTPSGVYQMESRHLKTLGYTSVPVLYSELHKNKSTLEHVTAIQTCIKASVESIPQT